MGSDSSKLPHDFSEIANRGLVFFTKHAFAEMIEENIPTLDVIDALKDCEVLEDYAEHQRGACCLVTGQTKKKRWLHIVCTTGKQETVVITVYEPKAPKWVTPKKRGEKS